jgi:hypothetical protein
MFGQLPKEFPDKWRNKVICGTASTTGKMMGGSTTFLDFPFRLTISDDGIFAEYNLDEKFGRDEWGKTQTVSIFEEDTRKSLIDSYNNIYGYAIYFKIPNAYRNSLGEVTGKHSITEIWLETYTDQSKNNVLGVKLASGAYNSTTVSSNHVTYQICESILSKEERKKLEEERKILENKKREEDKIVIEKLNKLIEQNMIIEASNEYSKLYFKNADFENKIQKGLDNIYGNETQDLEKDKINQFIISNKESFNKIKSGSYLVKINNQGQIFFGETDYSKDFTFSPITKAINSSFSVKINGTFTLNISDSIKSISQDEINNSGKKQFQWSVNPIYEKSTIIVKIKMDGDNINYINNDKYYFVEKENIGLNDNYDFISNDNSKLLVYNKNCKLDKISCSLLESKAIYVNGICMYTELGYYRGWEFNLKKKKRER